MNEANPVLENSHATVTPTQERPGAADHDAGEFQDATPQVYKTRPNRSIRGNFMDFFAPRRRQPDGQVVPIYKTLTEAPADSVQIAKNPEMLQISDIQPSETLETPEIMGAQTEQSIKRAIFLDEELPEPISRRIV